MSKTILMQSSNPAAFTPPSNLKSNQQYIFVKFIYDSDKINETKGKYSFYIYFDKGFPGGDIEIENLSTGEVINIKGYNNSSGVFRYDLDDIKFSFTYYEDDNPKTISKTFYFKNALNFGNTFKNSFIFEKFKPMIFDGYLKIAYNKNSSDFDAHLYFNDDKTHSLNVGCYSYQDLDLNYYDPKIKDFTIFKMAYDSPKLGILTTQKCLTDLWNVKTKATIVDNPKSFYDFFFFYKNLKKSLVDKGIDNNPFRFHYVNPIIQTHSLIIEYCD